MGIDLSDDVTMTFRFCSSNTIRVRQTRRKKKKRERVQGPETELNTFLFTAVATIKVVTFGTLFFSR
jgi:hypothetical protein